MQKPPVWFTIMAAMLTLWGLAGCASLYPNLTYDPNLDPNVTPWDRANMPMPGWLMAVYVVAVGSGVGGAIALFVKRRIAVSLSTIALIAVVVQFGYVFLATGIVPAKGLWTAYFPMAIFAIQLFQLWLARLADRRRWLR